MYRDVASQALPTHYGRELPYINEFVRQHFRLDNLKMVRDRNLVDGMVIPHKDFVEFGTPKDRFFRVFVALEDNAQAFHSDETAIFRMRKGEVWFLNAAIVHAAANFSRHSRHCLCLDFIFPGEFSPADIFVDGSVYDPTIRPFQPNRELAPDCELGIEQLASIVTGDNFRDLTFLLAKLHFRKEVPIGACYDWLVEIGNNSGDPAIAHKARKLRSYLTEQRDMGERFAWDQW